MTAPNADVFGEQSNVTQSLINTVPCLFTEFSTGARLAAVSDLGGHVCQHRIPREIPDHLHHKRFNQSAPGPF